MIHSLDAHTEGTRPDDLVAKAVIGLGHQTLAIEGAHVVGVGHIVTVQEDSVACAAGISQG